MNDMPLVIRYYLRDLQYLNINDARYAIPSELKHPHIMLNSILKSDPMY